MPADQEHCRDSNCKALMRHITELDVRGNRVFLHICESCQVLYLECNGAWQHFDLNWCMS